MDGWLCGDCRSLNTPRAKRCYRCNAPRGYVERDLDLESTTIVRTRPTVGAPEPAAPVNRFAQPLAPAELPDPPEADPAGSSGKRRFRRDKAPKAAKEPKPPKQPKPPKEPRRGRWRRAKDPSGVDRLMDPPAVPVAAAVATAPRRRRRVVRGMLKMAASALVLIGALLLAQAGSPGLVILLILLIIAALVLVILIRRGRGGPKLDRDPRLEVAAVEPPPVATPAPASRPAPAAPAMPAPVATPPASTAFEAALRAAAEANAVASVEQHGAMYPDSVPYRVASWQHTAGRPYVAAPAAAPLDLDMTAFGTAEPGAGAGSTAVDDGGPVLRPVLRPPAFAGGRKEIARTEAPAGAQPIVFVGEVPFVLPEPEAVPRAKGRWSTRLPKWALVVAAIASVLAIAGGVLLAGTKPQPTTDPAALAVDGGSPRPGLASPAPVASSAPVASTAPIASSAPVASAAAVVASVAPDASPAPVSSVAAASARPERTPRPTPSPSPVPSPTPTPAPTPIAWMAARDHLAASTFDEGWVGRFELSGTLKAGERKPATWAFSVARDGTDEWSRNRTQDPTSGLQLATEQLLVGRTTFIREGKSPWESRSRSFGDQPTEPLFGVRSADELTYVETIKEDGHTRFVFTIGGGNDLLALEQLRTFGLGSLPRTAATVVTETDGTPVRAELTYAGTTRAGKTRLDVEVRYHDIDGSFQIAAPKDGGPVIEG